jgi:hypothetical protein
VTQPGRAERAKEEAAQQKERERRQRAVAKAQSALDACSSEARKERCGHPSPDRSSRGKVSGRNRTLGEEEGSVGSSVCDGREEGENAAETLLFEMCFACKAVTAEE